jgi:hypothetical protein
MKRTLRAAAILQPASGCIHRSVAGVLCLLVMAAARADIESVLLPVEERTVVDAGGRRYRLEHRATGEGDRWIVHNGTGVPLHVTTRRLGDLPPLRLGPGDSIASPCERGVNLVGLAWGPGLREAIVLLCGDVVTVDEAPAHLETREASGG